MSEKVCEEYKLIKITPDSVFRLIDNLKAKDLKKRTQLVEILINDRVVNKILTDRTNDELDDFCRNMTRYSQKLKIFSYRHPNSRRLLIDE